MKKIILVVVLGCFCVGVFGQVMFQEEISSSFGIFCNSGQPTIDGGYIITGSAAYSSINFGVDAILTKIDQFGAIQWSKYATDSLNQQLLSVKQTNDGGYITGGFTEHNPNLGFLVKKYNSFGGSSWSRTYRTPLSNFAGCSAVEQTADLGYILVGHFDELNAHGMLLLKINNFGSLIWSKKMATLNGLSGNSIKQTSDGGYIISASGYPGSILIKTDSIGNAIWSKNYSGLLSSGDNALLSDSDGGYLMVGSVVNSTYDKDICLLKTNSLGDTLWTKLYGGDSTDIAYSVSQTNDGGFVIGGTTLSFGSQSEDAYLIKTDSSGNYEWSKTYSRSNLAFATAQQTIDGGYFILGGVSSYIWVIKTDANGNSGCNEMSPPTVTRTFITSITIPTVLESSGAVSGIPTFTNSNFGSVYPICTTVDVKGENLNSELSLSPNPFSSSFTLTFSETPKNASLKVINILGEVVFQSEIKNLKSEINLSNQSSGMYFVNVQTDKGIVSRKLIKQ